MAKILRKTLVFVSSAAIAASMITVPITANAEDYEPIISGDTVLNEWKLDFTSGDAASGYTHVNKTAHPIVGDLHTGAETEYGFVGTYDDDFNFSGRYDSLTMTKGHTTKLEQTANGTGSVGSESGTDGFDYPTRFAMYVDNGSYYRVRATITNLEDGKDATDVALYYERKHPVMSHETISAGEEITIEFSVDVENIYFEKSSPKGVFKDDMLNIVLAGSNAAFKQMDIQKVEPGTTLWVLGDSTVTDGGSALPFFELNNYTGVGASLSKYVPKNVAVSNQGEGGLAAGDNYHFNIAKNNIKAGDYMYVEYGHNHKNDGVAGYLSHLNKYYQACKSPAKGGTANGGKATLVIVGPIDRHQDSQYTSSTNTWSSTLNGYSKAGKAYVDCMLYGGETAASTFVSKYSSNDNAVAAAAYEYADSVIKAGKNSDITNIAFVDLNQPTLDWLTSVTASGTVAGTEYKNEIKLADYYFYGAKNTSHKNVDGTHPNDAGSEALAEKFFLGAAAKLVEYPALSGLLNKYDGTTPADDSTPSGRLASAVAQRILDAGWAGNSEWPAAVSEYSVPCQINMINLDDDNTLLSVDVEVLDNTIMPNYGRCLVAAYNEDKTLKSVAVSTNWVENSAGNGEQNILFDTDLKIDNDNFKVFLWGMEDVEGYPLTMAPFTDGTYTPKTYDYILTNDGQSGPECFHYYGLKSGSEITSGKNSWTISGIAATSMTGEDSSYYGAFTGSGTMTKSLTKTMAEGIVQIEGSIKSNSGTVTIGLSDGTNTIAALTSEDVTAGEWTDFVYTLDINRGKATLTIGGADPVITDVDAYKKINADNVKPSKISAIKITASSADFALTNLAVKSMVRTDALESYNVTGSYTADSSADMGTVTPETTSAYVGSTVTLTAANNSGYRFIGWYDAAEEGTLLSTGKSINIRVNGDATVYAKFEVHEGFYFEDNFEEYEAKEYIHQAGQSDSGAPADVTLGSLILSAGYRNNGAADTSAVKIETANDNKYMTCIAGNTANASRGVKFTFASPVDIEEKTIVWEFDAKFPDSGASELLTGIGSFNASNIEGLSDNEWVNVKFIFDKTASKQYIVVTKDGKIVNIAESALAATQITGATFYTANAGSMSFDNMKIYDLGTNGTIASEPVETTVKAPAGAVVNVANNEITIGEDGTATVALVQGVEYNVNAVCGGYDDFEAAIEATNGELIINMTAKTGSTTSVTVNFLDGESNQIKDAEVLTNDETGAAFYTGDSFELPNEYKKVLKIPEEGDKYTIYSLNSECETGIAELAESENEINLVYTLKAEHCSYYEDFEYSSDISMITSSSNSVNKILTSNKTNSSYLLRMQNQNGKGGNAIYTISSAGLGEGDTVTFHGLISIGSSNSANTVFSLQDTAGTSIFSLKLTSYAGALTVNDDETSLPVTKVKGGGITSAGSTSDTAWMDVTAVIDFTKTEDNVELTILDTANNNAVVYEGTLTTAATNISKMSATLGKGYSGMGYDDIMVY